MTKAQEKALETLPKEGFHFSEEGHLYVLDGRPLTGVTTILGVIAKPALIQWAANEAVKYLGWFDERYCTDRDSAIVDLSVQLAKIKDLDIDSYLELLCEARTQHAKRKKDAGGTGTDVHAQIEELVKIAIQNNQGKLQSAENSNELVKNFCKWATDNDITFLESEKRLYSKEHWYAGTCDLVFLQGGKKHIGDVKTSSGIYGREFFAQMAGYQIALEEMGEIKPEEIFARTVIRCGKDGSFEVKDSFDFETDKKIFLAALDLYRGLETF